MKKNKQSKSDTAGTLTFKYSLVRTNIPPMNETYRNVKSVERAKDIVKGRPAAFDAFFKPHGDKTVRIK